MSVLDRIFQTKAEEVARAKVERPLVAVRADAESAGPTRGFRAALASRAPELALIAEVKKASPSKGVIRADFDPVAIARCYERAGAACLSVLTDVSYFQGSPENLRLCREATALPALRKDFLNDPYQVYEARAWGADAILLIMASLGDAQAGDLAQLARELGMDALVEVHTLEETERALALGFDLIGVNNRSLIDFSTDLATSERLLPLIAPHALAVSESALETRGDLDRVQRAGARAVLIGTSFCAAPDIEAKVREVMGA
jgi:indole-3-glycerol phosphate synthase